MRNPSFVRLCIAFAAVACLFVGQVQAQCYGASQSVNELGIRLGSVTNASSDGGIYIADKTSHLGVLNGIHYKRYGSIGAFRTSLGLTRYDHQDRRGCPDCLRIEGKVSSVKVRVGYEWFAMLGALEPFAGIDVLGSYGTYTGEQFSTSSVDYRETTDNRIRRGMGFAPVLGLRLWLGYSISVSAETSYEAMFFGHSTRISQISPEATTFTRANNYFQGDWMPLNWLSLNVMF
jgi:hypothetical protein